MLENPGVAEAERRIGIARRSGTAILDLSWLHLDVIPDSLGQLSQLQTVFFFHNHITAIPDWLAELSQLRYLELSDNQITAIPGSLGKLTQLEMLNLSDNQITAIPDSLAALENLTQLFLHGNPNLGIRLKCSAQGAETNGPNPPRKFSPTISLSAPARNLSMRRS